MIRIQNEIIQFFIIILINIYFFNLIFISIELYIQKINQL